MIPRLHNQHEIFGRIGSFWHSAPTEQTKKEIRRLVHGGDHSRIVGQLAAAQDNLEGARETTEENLTRTFSFDDIVFVGPDIQQRVVEHFATAPSRFILTRRPTEFDLGLTGYNELITVSPDNYKLTTESCEVIFWPMPEDVTDVAVPADMLKSLYLLSIPMDLQVQSISTFNSLLIQGVDFVSSQGLLLFYENPLTLFPEGRIIMKVSYKTRRSLMSYTMQLDNVVGKVDFVARYYREHQSPGAFGAAIAQAAGLAVMPWTGIVRQRLELCADACHYVFDRGALTVPYSHELLEIGQEYPEGWVIGDKIKVLISNNINPTWFRQLDWSDGLSLDTLCPVKGITVPDTTVRAYAVAEAQDVHVRLALQGTDEDLVRYWEFVRQSEVASGYFLNAVIGLADINDQAFVNPLDIFFTYLLGRRGIVVELNTQEIGMQYHQRALDFIHREKPVGSIIIIR